MFACGDGEEEMVLVANGMEKETGKRVGEGDCEGVEGSDGKADLERNMTEQQKKVLDRLQAQCSKREYCRRDVFDKAQKALEGDREAAEEVVEALVADKFVDEARYAGAFAREKARLQGWGPVKISAGLSAKGIPQSVIREALDTINPEEADAKMESVLKAKYRTLEGEPDAKLKLLRFALSRGYSYNQVRESVDRITKA